MSTETEQHEMTYADELDAEFQRAIRYTCADAVALEAGDAGEADPREPYRELAENFTRAKASLEVATIRARKLAGHQHNWGDDDRCVECGMDGRS